MSKFTPYERKLIDEIKQEIKRREKIARDAEHYLAEIDSRERIAKEYKIHVDTVSRIHRQRNSAKLSDEQVKDLCRRMDVIREKHRLVVENSRNRMSIEYQKTTHEIGVIVSDEFVETKSKPKADPVREFLQRARLSSNPAEGMYYGFAG